jgi:hypothetical protein
VVNPVVIEKSESSTLDSYRVIINDCLIAVGVGDIVECAASFIK